MLVVFDTQFVALFLHPAARVPDDPTTHAPLTDAAGRIEHLVANLEEQDATILIPTPALAEFLVLAGSAGPQYLSELKNHTAFKIEPFDEMAAIEAAASEVAAMTTGDKRGGATGEWQKIKVDRQIVAIAKTRGAASVYSNDSDIMRLGARDGMAVVTAYALPLPPAKEGTLPFESQS